MPSEQQAIWISRFHKHLARAGRPESLEQAARIWISRYARQWRTRYGKLHVG